MSGGGHSRSRWNVEARQAPDLAALERLIAGYRPSTQRLAAFAAGGSVVWHRAISLRGYPMIVRRSESRP